MVESRQQWALVAKTEKVQPVVHDPKWELMRLEGYNYFW